MSKKRLKQSFDQVEQLCEEKGYQSYYNSFESFKTAFYTQKEQI
ncbi:hypothetical protein [Dyadobacter chenwenxiniae]|nr:hypothetical protein [Dyadobacter chenwenxiniae]